MTRQSELFHTAPATKATPAHAPLAERMRPRAIDDFVGQQHLLGPGHVLRDMIESGRVESLILWGPPGSGKTTLAYLLAAASGAPAVAFSAVLQGVKELRQIVDDAALTLARTGGSTVLFVDEIHRFNKAQQDAFLPHVEAGTITLVGATTENPSFEVIAPLLSRTRVLTFEPLGDAETGAVIDRALADPERGLGRQKLALDAEARAFLVAHAQGDARVALNALELAARLARARRTHPARAGGDLPRHLSQVERRLSGDAARLGGRAGEGRPARPAPPPQCADAAHEGPRLRRRLPLPARPSGCRRRPGVPAGAPRRPALLRADRPRPRAGDRRAAPRLARSAGAEASVAHGHQEEAVRRRRRTGLRAVAALEDVPH